MKKLYNSSIVILLLFLSSAAARGQYADFSISYFDDCEPVYVYFTNSSDTGNITGHARFTWYIDGVPYNTYELPEMEFYKGNHEVELTFWDDAGEVDTHWEEFEIYGKVNDFKTSTGPEACPGEWISFWIEDEWYTNEWNFGDGSFSTTEGEPSHQFFLPGIYDVTLIASNLCGTDTVVKQINVSNAAKPYVEAYTELDEYCINDEVTFYTDMDFKSFLWNFGDGETSTEKNPSHFYDTQVERNYTVTLTATNSCGNSNTDTIQVNFVADKSAIAYFDYYYQGDWINPCPNVPIQFNARVPGTYEWDFGDGSTSTERYPRNIYPVPGDYLVRLYVTNGCGYTTEYSELITVMLNLEDVPYVDFIFEAYDIPWDELMYLDTLTVCQGELVKFMNNSDSYNGSDLKFNWNFGDGQTSKIKNPSHVYTAPGYYTVRLTVTTLCGGSDWMEKWVHVDNSKQPEAYLGVVPEVICTGEQVYFYDESDFEERNWVYNIDFGDGTSVNNITEPTDTILYTLANHTYTGTPGTIYIYNFSVTNQCGNTQTKNGTITITDDPMHKPFYYVENTAEVEENRPPADWSKRKDPTDHEVTILVSWPLWYAGLDNNFYIYFWYGGFDSMAEDPGPADGFVHFISPDITLGETVTAYIPIDPLQEPFVGMAAGWNCTGIAEPGIEPDAWGMPMDAMGGPITGINIVPVGFTDLQTLAPSGIVIDPDWDGICQSDQPFERSFYEVSPNTYVHLNMWEDMTYELYGSDDPQGYNTLAEISYGTWENYGGNEIVFTDWGTECVEMSGQYLYIKNGDSIEFSPIYDACTQRLNYLTKQKFIRKPDYGMVEDFSGCPGDDVLFKIAGGVSYEWHFGDGTAPSNEQYPKHAYSEPGIYDAYVIATNACGRTDTVWTRVTIKNDNLPYADFWIDKYDAPRFEPFQFMTDYDWLDQAGNYTYLWNFGDGFTSTASNPSHIYEKDGDYTVKLEVTNGCGTTTNMVQIWVQDASATCIAKFDFTVSGDTTIFNALSWGEPTSWFWDFGDGTTSNLPNPKHVYSRDGIYFVCLSIFDENTDCASQICREVPVGTVGCRADFRFTVNEALKSVRFTDASTNAQEWFWDFGDGTYSSLQNPVKIYKEPGVYVVYLATYNNLTGCFAETVKEIQVGADQTDICIADFSFFVDETNKKVVFTDKSSSNGSISSWYWTFGDGTYKSERHPEHIYPRNGIYEVCLIVFDKITGLSAEICKKIPVGVSLCNINANFSHFIDISNNTVTFNNKSTGNITKWFWNFGDGTTSSQKNPKHTYKNPGFYLVTLSVFDASNDCADHTAEFIQVGQPDCRAYFEYSIDATSNKVSFVNKSKGNLSEYFWFFGDGSYSVDPNPVHQFEHPGLYFVELTVVDASGICMDYYFEPIQVGNLTCRAKFDYFIDSLTNVAYFTPDAIGDITHYLWFFGDGSVSTEENPIHVFTQPGYFTVGLNTFDEFTDCMDYYEEIILIGREGIDCRANFMYMTDPNSLNVSFTNNSKGDIVDYIWNFGDRQTSQDKQPTHTYLEGGYYLVCLTVVNSYGITNTRCNIIQVAPGQSKDCLAKFIYTVDSTNLSVRFTDKSFGKPDGWFWDFDDGTSSTSKDTVVHKYNQKGFYMVTLSIANSIKNCTSRASKLINVGMGNQGLEADFSYKIDSINLKADSYPVDFIGVSLGDGNKLKWEFGDGAIDTTSLQPTHVYNAPGIYTVCLTISNPVTQDSARECETLYVGVSGTDDVSGLFIQLGNYPNPFRDITNIVYRLATAGDVDLSIFDNSGRKIETLVSEYKDAGKHIIEYNGSYLDSGVYHLRLMTRNHVITSMMIVR